MTRSQWLRLDMAFKQRGPEPCPFLPSRKGAMLIQNAFMIDLRSGRSAVPLQICSSICLPSFEMTRDNGQTSTYPEPIPGSR